MPQGIEEINIKSARIFFDEELKLENISVHTNEDGTKVIETALHGSQTRYNNPSAQGTTVVITTDITLNKLTPTTNAQIDVFTENDDENKTEASNNTNLKLIDQPMQFNYVQKNKTNLVVEILTLEFTKTFKGCDING